MKMLVKSSKYDREMKLGIEGISFEMGYFSLKYRIIWHTGGATLTYAHENHEVFFLNS